MPCIAEITMKTTKHMLVIDTNTIAHLYKGEVLLVNKPLDEVLMMQIESKSPEVPYRIKLFAIGTKKERREILDAVYAFGEGSFVEFFPAQDKLMQPLRAIADGADALLEKRARSERAKRAAETRRRNKEAK